MDERAKDVSRWLPEAQAGSPEALGQVLEVYRRYLLQIAGQELDSDLQAKAGASDLVQDTFIEAQRDFAGFHGTTEGELRAWLRRLLLNNLANFVRRYRGAEKRQVGREVPLDVDRSAGGPGEPAADAPSPSGEAVAQEQAEAVQRALGRLSPEYRQVLTWRYQEQLSFEEIGRLLERTPNAARKLFARAVERFQHEMEAEP